MLTGGMLSFEWLYYPSQSLFHNYEFWSRIHENRSDFYTELCFGCLMFALWLFRACWLEQCDPVFCMIRSFIHHCSTATNPGPGFMRMIWILHCSTATNPGPGFMRMISILHCSTATNPGPGFMRMIWILHCSTATNPGPGFMWMIWILHCSTATNPGPGFMWMIWILHCSTATNPGPGFMRMIWILHCSTATNPDPGFIRMIWILQRIIYDLVASCSWFMTVLSLLTGAMWPCVLYNHTIHLSLLHSYQTWSMIHENWSDFYSELCFSCLMQLVYGCPELVDWSNVTLCSV